MSEECLKVFILKNALVNFGNSELWIIKVQHFQRSLVNVNIFFIKMELEGLHNSPRGPH